MKHTEKSRSSAPRRKPSAPHRKPSPAQAKPPSPSESPNQELITSGLENCPIRERAAVKPAIRAEDIDPRDDPVQMLPERTLIHALLRHPDLLEDMPVLRDVDPVWHLKAIHKLAWKVALDEAANAKGSGPIARAVLRRLVAEERVPAGLAADFVWGLPDDPLAAPTERNVPFYAACVAAGSVHPYPVRDALQRRMNVLNTGLGVA